MKNADRSGKQPGDRTLVVVDDEPNISIVLEETLRSAGYGVTGFNDSKEALDFLLSGSESVDMVLSDINMPDLDGLELMSSVLRKYPDMPFLIATGIKDVETGIEAMKLGAFDYVTKPFQTDQILMSVEKSLKHADLVAENRQYHDNLENLVEERTRELQEANSKKLDEAYRQLLQADKLNSLGLMAGTLAHDISSPMQVISSIGKSWLERYKGSIDSEDQEMFTRSINKIISLIRTVQNFVRSGDTPAEMSARKLIEDSLLLSSKYLQKKGVRIDADYSSEPDVVYCRPNEVEQVLTNLIHNAVHAMERNLEEKRLWIETKRSEFDGKPAIEISIRDNGQGISPENIDRIFDSFFTTKPTGKGTGLGLSICRRIVTEHDGKVWVESTSGEGATFRILIPVMA